MTAPEKKPEGFKGRVNVYECETCGGRTVTIDVDAGVTPFLLHRPWAQHVNDRCRGLAINGYPVVRQRTFPRRAGTRPGRVIIVDRRCEPPSPRYVVAVVYGADSCWDNGDYCNTAEKADERFEVRLARANGEVR